MAAVYMWAVSALVQRLSMPRRIVFPRAEQFTPPPLRSTFFVCKLRGEELAGSNLPLCVRR